MDLFRFSKDVFGQKMLVGVNWDFIWVPIFLAALLILSHIIFRVFVKHE